MRQKHWGLLFFASLTLALLTACSPANTETPTSLPTLAPSPQPATDTPPAPRATLPPALQQTTGQSTRIRFVHAAADAPPLTVYYGLSAVATNLEFGLYTEPASIPSGTVTLRVLPSGASSTTEPLLTISTTLPENENTLMIFTTDDNGLAYLTLPDSVVPVNAGESAVRVIQMTDDPAVMVTIGSTTIAPSIGAQEASEPEILPAGDTTVTFSSGGTPLLDYPITLREQEDYTLIFTQDGDQYRVIEYALSAPGRTNARVVNASSAYNAIDVYVDDVLLATNTGSYRVSSREAVLSGQHEISVYAAGTDTTTSTPLIQKSLFLENGAASIYFFGTENDRRLVAAADNLTPTPPDTARIAFVNTLDTIPAIQSERIPLDSGVNFGEAPVTTELLAGTYTFSWTGINTEGIGVGAEQLENAILEAGRSYLYLITGQEDNQGVILSDFVGINSLLPIGDIADSDLLETPAQLRFINVADVPADILTNESVILTNLAPRQGSTWINMNQRSPFISAQQHDDSGAGVQLAEESWVLESGQLYTIILSGPDQDHLSLLLVPDNTVILDGFSIHLRLINISPEPRTHLSLGYSTSKPAEDNGTPFVGIPDSVRRLEIEAAGGAASSPVLMPEGAYNISVLDVDQGRVLTVLAELQLESGQHYDIIAYEYPESASGYAFVVPYPALD
ncbi:MAG: DUF4397 domain-containing protein [Anaerolineaceae bacterium]|nr:DUF4397 domain-containing protein [Anaerolineaceae bacterium]